MEPVFFTIIIALIMGLAVTYGKLRTARRLLAEALEQLS